MTNERTLDTAKSKGEEVHPAPDFYEVMKSNMKAAQQKPWQPSNEADRVFGQVLLNFDGQQENVSGYAEKNFDRLDTNKNGYISEREIFSAYSRSKQLEQFSLVGLHRFHKEIQNTSNDEWFEENDGITRSDLDAYKTVLYHRERARRSRVDE